MPYGKSNKEIQEAHMGGVGKYKSPNKYTPYKMTGHELPGIKQKSAAKLKAFDSPTGLNAGMVDGISTSPNKFGMMSQGMDFARKVMGKRKGKGGKMWGGIGNAVNAVTGGGGGGGVAPHGDEAHTGGGGGGDGFQDPLLAGGGAAEGGEEPLTKKQQMAAVAAVDSVLYSPISV